jgi:hypothetical protein
MMLQIPLPPEQLLKDTGHSNLLLYLAIIFLGLLIIEYMRTISKLRNAKKEKDIQEEGILNELNITLKKMDGKLQQMHEEESLRCMSMQQQISVNRIHIMAIEKYMTKTGFNAVPWEIEK